MKILETERLLLRHLTPDDLNDLWALYCDPEITKFIPDAPRNYAEAKEELAWHQHGHPRHPELGLCATVHKASGQFIGRCGLLPWTIDGVDEVEVAYTITQKFWGQGLATEAARAIRDYAFQRLGLTRLVCLIDAENRASARVAEKMGMRFEKEAEDESGPFLLYAMTRTASPAVLLETDRLILRRFTESDAEHIFALDNDPAVMRYINGGIPTPWEVIEQQLLPNFLRYNDATPGFGFWAAIEKATGEFVGWFVFRPTGDDPGEVALGYRFHKGAWGNGYATEGAQALIERGFGEWGVRRVIATTYEENRASRRVMEKLGMRHERSFRYSAEEIGASDTSYTESEEVWPGEDVEYAITRTEWKEQRARNGFHIRPYRLTDADAVSGIIRRTMHVSNSADYPLEQLQPLIDYFSPAKVEQINRTRTCLVAEANGQLVATAGLEDDEIVTFFVLPEQQGRGIGSALLQKLEAYARGQEIAELKLHASLTGAPFYARHGFQPTGEVMDGTAGPQISMRKQLE